MKTEKLVKNIRQNGGHVTVVSNDKLIVRYTDDLAGVKGRWDKKKNRWRYTSLTPNY